MTSGVDETDQYAPVISRCSSQTETCCWRYSQDRRQEPPEAELVAADVLEHDKEQRKPIIAIASRIGSQQFDSVRHGLRWQDYCNSTCVEAIIECGGSPIILPWVKFPETHYASILREVDGLVIPGDDNPDPPKRSTARRAMRLSDEFDRGLLNIAHSNRMPVLGLCRGIQVINEWLGGTIQNVSPRHYQTPTFIAHQLRIIPTSGLRDIVGLDRVAANTMHSHACSRLGANVTVNCRSEEGIIEGIEWNVIEQWWMMAFQSNPEELWRFVGEWGLLFKGFVAAAGRFRDDKQDE